MASGKGGRPKGGSAKIDKDDKTLPSQKEAVDTVADVMEDTDLRTAIQEMLDVNMKNLPTWLKQVGEQNPEKALNIFKDFTEYVIPKKQREDGKTDGSSPITINFTPSSQIVPQDKPRKQFPSNNSKPNNEISDDKLDELIVS